PLPRQGGGRGGGAAKHSPEIRGLHLQGVAHSPSPFRGEGGVGVLQRTRPRSEKIPLPCVEKSAAPACCARSRPRQNRCSGATSAESSWLAATFAARFRSVGTSPTSPALTLA